MRGSYRATGGVVVAAFVIALLNAGGAGAKETPGADAAVTAFNLQHAIALAMLIKKNEIEQNIAVQTSEYHPLTIAQVNGMTDIRALHNQVIAAQDAAKVAQSTVVADLDPKTAEALTTALGASLEQALKNAPLAGPIIVPLTSSKTMAIYNSDQSGVAAQEPSATQTTCDVFQYVTGLYGAAGPSTLTSNVTTGQKNTLAGIGLVLGMIPIVLHCTKEHSAENPNPKASPS
jgi:hypothetical protein